jgi:hypothetical protein
MFISAHTKYSAKLLEPLFAPDSDHVTILREPASHFRSSFNYWGVPEHIRSTVLGDQKNKDCVSRGVVLACNSLLSLKQADV